MLVCQIVTTRHAQHGWSQQTYVIDLVNNSVPSFPGLFVDVLMRTTCTGELTRY